MYMVGLEKVVVLLVVVIEEAEEKEEPMAVEMDVGFEVI